MRCTFKLEIDAVLDTASVPTVIEAARQCHAGAVAASVDGQGASRTVPAEEFINGIDDALMELLERNPLLANAEVEVERVSCWSDAASFTAGPASETTGLSDEIGSCAERPIEADEGDSDLDDFETGLYLCRWPNGDFSLVKADSKNHAVVHLDEWAGAEPNWLIPVETCMVDFRLNDQGEIELAEFGEETEAFIWETCYPALNEVLSSEEVLDHLGGQSTSEAADKISRAVEHERKRLWHVLQEGRPAMTALGRELQERLGTVGTVADHYVQVAAKEILRGKAGEKGKPS